MLSDSKTDFHGVEMDDMQANIDLISSPFITFGVQQKKCVWLTNGGNFRSFSNIFSRICEVIPLKPVSVQQASHMHAWPKCQMCFQQSTLWFNRGWKSEINL